MKTKSEGHTWSSMKEVLESFNNVSVMPRTNHDESDLFFCPSPPRHRISPSQLELIESMGHNSNGVAKYRPSAVSRNYVQRISPKVRDATLTNDIRATKISTYSNDSIENYFNDKCYTSDRPPLVPEEEKDEISVDSVLRAEAEEFYPPGLTPDPQVLSDCLMKLKNEDRTDLVKSSGAKGTKLCSPYSPKMLPSSSSQGSCSSKNQSPAAVLAEPRIGFFIGSEDEDSSENESNVNVSSDPLTYFSLTTSKSQSTDSDLFTCSKSPVSVPPVINILLKPSDVQDSKTLSVKDKSNSLVVESDSSSAKPRRKRVMKNALLSSLSKNKPELHNHLLKPTDFCVGSGSNGFHSSNSSAFHRLESKDSKSKEHDPSHFYDFKTDPSIDEESKKLIASLTSTADPSPSLSLSSGRSSSVNSPTIRTAFFRAPKPVSSYDYKFEESDFPPLH